MPMNTPTLSISERLADLGANSTFATRFVVEADPQLHVQGIGEVSLPISIHAAHRLCAVAQPAQHGYKDETRLDPRVRDTWEIPADRIRLEAPQWRSVLDRALERVASDLGLPLGGRLEAELHNLLVYAPGQFFAVHQDSEKADGMLGTLVVTLPSSFTGGELVVSHQDQALRACGSANRLEMMAFYADCHHEVRPVKEGYRVVLTFNLLASGGPQPVDVPEQDLAALTAEVQRFWQTPMPPRWAGDDEAAPPDRLVYLLDYQYTQSGLSWARLKGADTVRVNALRRVAERLDAEIFLVLADVHETWSAEDDAREYDSWDRDEDGEETSDEDFDDPVLGELIDSDIELRHWLSPDGGEPVVEATGVARGELCLTRDSADCTPFRSEHEGYMGNYGNTVDRWYHRAAVVMWPRERAFVIRARQEPRWAIEQIARKIEAGDAAQALDWVRDLLPFWRRAVIGADDAALFGASLPVAAVLADAQCAWELLEPFSLQQLTAEDAPRLLQLLERHGLEWCGECLRRWAQPYRTSEARLAWAAEVLPALTEALCLSANRDGPALAAALAEEQWGWLRRHFGQAQTVIGGAAGIRAMVAMSPALLGLLRGSSDTRCVDLRTEIMEMLLSAGCPLQVPLRVLHAVAEADMAVAPGLARLHAHCMEQLDARLAQPERSADDWSILPPPDCVGEPGEKLARFLESSVQRRLEWRLAEPGRRVVHQLIDRHELPVRYETRRTGRPYTLVLEKTDALFERERVERREWADEIAWLRQTGDVFSRGR